MTAEAAGSYHDSQFYMLHAAAELARSVIEQEIKASGIYAHQVTSRVKSRESYVSKASRLTEAGKPKYSDPAAQITDLVGVRVVVSIAADVTDMASLVRSAFQVVEEVDRGNESHVDRPGYQSRHLVVHLKPETLVAVRQPTAASALSIEVQVRSILQDALASFEHDLSYKAERPSSALTRRRLVEVASLLHVTDRLFSQLRSEVAAEVDLATADVSEKLQVGDEWTQDELDGLVQELIGPTEADPSPWLEQLRLVLSALGYPRPEDFATVKSRIRNGELFAREVRKQRPWATGTQVLDLLLRAELGEAYFDQRSAELDRGDVDHDRDAFRQERESTLDLLEHLG